MNANDLLVRLRLLRGITAKKSYDPVLTALWSSGPWLTTSDHDTTLMAKTGIHLDRPVHCGAFFDAVKGMDGPVEVLNEADGAVVRAGGRSVTVPFLDACTPPKMTALDPKQKFSFSVDRDELAYVEKAISTETVRYSLSGMLLDPTHLRMAGSDGKRLHIRPFATERGQWPKIVVPRKAVQALTAVLKAEIPIESIQLLKITDTEVSDAGFHGKNFTVLTKTVQSTWPDYRSILPAKHHWTLGIETDGLRIALRTAHAFLRKHKVKMPFVRLQLLEKEVAVSAIAENGKETFGPVKVQTHRRTGEIRGFDGMYINPEYLAATMFAEGITHLQGSIPSTVICIDGTSLCMPMLPNLATEARRELDAISEEFSKIRPMEDPIKFPESPVMNQIPKPQEVVAEPEERKCLACGDPAAVGKDYCAACEARAAARDRQARPDPYRLRRKIRMRNIKLTEQDLMDVIETATR